MIIIPFTQLKEFILSQSNDKKVVMFENYSHHPCGCLLVQYTKEKLDIKGKFACGYNSVIREKGFINNTRLAEFENAINFIHDCFGLTNYGEVKEVLKNYSPFDDSMEYHKSFA